VGGTPAAGVPAFYGQFEPGFCGIVYRSAQQADMDCFAVFGPWLKTLRLKWAEPLVEEGTGSLHYLVEQLSRGACIPVVP